MHVKSRCLRNKTEHKVILFPIAGISDVSETYAAAIKGVAADSKEDVLKTSSMQEKASTFNDRLRSDQTTAITKIQEGLQYLSYVVISTSMPSA